MLQDNIKVKLSTGTDILIRAAAIAAAIVSLGAGYSFFLSYIYKPKIEVLSVDFGTGKARIKVIGLYAQVIEIEGETIYQISGDWGVRLASTVVSGESKYNRIELVRKGMVVEYLNKPNI